MSRTLKSIDTDHDPEPTVASRFYGWECETCGGPLCLSTWAGRALTGDDDGHRTGGAFLHDYGSPFYWNDAGYLTTELLTVLSLSIIPVTLVVVWVAKMAGMVAAV